MQDKDIILKLGELSGGLKAISESQKANAEEQKEYMKRDLTEHVEMRKEQKNTNDKMHSLEVSFNEKLDQLREDIKTDLGKFKKDFWENKSTTSIKLETLSVKMMIIFTIYTAAVSGAVTYVLNKFV